MRVSRKAGFVGNTHCRHFPAMGATNGRRTREGGLPVPSRPELILARNADYNFRRNLVIYFIV
jgi:hypothetical protein